MLKIIYFIATIIFAKNLIAAESFMLDNGMKIIVINNNKIPAINHMLIYKVGSTADPLGKSGLAHFVEHMMFKSTAKLKEGDFFRIIAENGGKLNAFTDLDSTGYYELISKNKLSLVMQMESDRMNKLNLNLDEVTRERNVIIQERSLRTDNVPKSLLYEQIQAALYINHQNHRPVIGFKNEMENLQLADISEFHNLYYRPSNAILIVAGDIDAETLKPLAKKYYGKLKNPKTIKQPTYVIEAPQIAARNLTYCDSRTKIESIIRVFQVPILENFKDEISVNLISYIVGGSKFSRFYEYFIKEKKMASDISTGYYNNGKNSPGMFTIDIDVNEDISNVTPKLNEQIIKLYNQGVTESELNIAKESLIASHIYSSESFKNLAYIYAYMAVNDISLDNFTNYSKIVESIDVDQVNKIIQKIFDANRSVTAKLYKDPIKCQNYVN